WEPATARSREGSGPICLRRQNDLGATGRDDGQRNLAEAEELACMIRDASVYLSQAEAADLDGPDRGDADHALGVDHELLAGDVEPTDELDLDHVTGADSLGGS